MFLTRWFNPVGTVQEADAIAPSDAGGDAAPFAPDDGSDGPAAGGDFLSQAVAEAIYQASDAAKKPSTSELERAQALAERGRDLGKPDDLDKVIERLLLLVQRYPHYERFQIYVARALETHKDKRASSVWHGIDQRFAKSTEAFRLVLRWTARDFGRDRAQQLLIQRYPELPVEPDDLILYARACEELRNFIEADEAYARLEELETATPVHYATMASAVRRRGEVWRAAELVEGGQARFGANPRLQRVGREIDADIVKISAVLPNVDVRSARVSNVVLDRVMSDLAAQRSHAPHDERTFVGPLVMIGSSLGCGGAERQFTNTALSLKASIEQGRPVAGYDILGPVTAICRSLKSRSAGDFFLKDFERSQIPVLQYCDFPDYGGNVRHSVAKNLIDILRYLPAPIAESIRKLADVLAAMRPEIAHIWQDGAILATGIAALLAEVPRIVLSVRSVPPVDRPERHRHEYEVIFRTLLASPGVTLTANSQSIAQRYAQWLQIDPHRIDIIRNGWEAPAITPDEQSGRRFQEFDAQTEGATLTVGSVFRFDENKRPFLWLDSAAQLLQREPGARFILVGDGVLLESARQYAGRLGIAGRVLFTGRSSVVGFWLSKMDTFLLLSRFEGLPNVLIEAQFAGLPVVTTDAGGAGETILPGRTGTVLPNVEAPAPNDIASAVLHWQRDAAGRSALAATATEWANTTFSVEAMLRKTVQVYMSQG